MTQTYKKHKRNDTVMIFLNPKGHRPRYKFENTV
jgi:hypothetical protein